jgi:hypothetical protein
VNVTCWGEVLITDGWSFGPKQHAISVFYQQAGDHQRRAVALARRFDAMKRPEKTLAFPFALEGSRRIRARELVLNPPASDQLRAHTASSKDRREAMLMLAWYGWPYSRGTVLRPELPGVDLKGSHRRVWDMETGNLLNDGDRVKVPAAPVTMFRALYARTADRPAPPRPDGLCLGLSFDRGLKPDLGGGLLTEHGNGECRGNALQVRAGGGSAEYGVVPSWFSGTIEFDLTVKRAGAEPLALVRCRHHMDTTLSLVQKKGRPGLLLQSVEHNGKKAYWKFSEIAPIPDAEPERRETWVGLPTDGKAHRVVLAWEQGQYRIFVDGKLEGILAKPAVMRWRDDTLFEPGLILGAAGDAGRGGEASIDSVFVYDWSFRDQDAKTRTAATGFEPLARPTGQKPSLWLWGEKPGEGQVLAVNFRRCDNGVRTMNVKATLFEKTKTDGRRRLSTGSTKPYRGVGNILFEYEPEAEMATEATLEKTEEIEGLDELMQPEKVYILVVKSGAAGKDPPALDFEFTFGERAINHW